MDKKAAADFITNVAGARNVFTDEPMKNHTSFKVGGPADILVTPQSKEQLIKILDYCKSNSIPFYIVGNGTNLIVRDKGIRGVVIKLFNNLNDIKVEGNVICAQSGALLSRIAYTAYENGLSGFEFAHGIPGTLGGAVAMNAGAYGGEIKDVVIKTDIVTEDGKVITLRDEEHQFSYRDSYIQRNHGVVLRSWIKLKSDSKEEIKARMDELLKRRKDKQPLEMPSAGSTFKRPEGHFAGKLIEDCELKGFTLGGAQVSTKHCGFVVNAGNATAEDILNLIKYIQKNIKDKFDVDLETEVRIIGEE